MSHEDELAVPFAAGLQLSSLSEPVIVKASECASSARSSSVRPIFLYTSSSSAEYSGFWELGTFETTWQSSLLVFLKSLLLFSGAIGSTWLSLLLLLKADGGIAESSEHWLSSSLSCFMALATLKTDLSSLAPEVIWCDFSLQCLKQSASWLPKSRCSDFSLLGKASFKASLRSAGVTRCVSLQVSSMNSSKLETVTSTSLPLKLPTSSERVFALKHFATSLALTPILVLWVMLPRAKPAINIYESCNATSCMQCSWTRHVMMWCMHKNMKKQCLK